MGEKGLDFFGSQKDRVRVPFMVTVFPRRVEACDSQDTANYLAQTHHNYVKLSLQQWNSLLLVFKTTSQSVVYVGLTSD